MEIDAAVRGCSDVHLQAKYDRAVFVIERTFALYPFEEVAFSFNGGKDSTVLLHLLRAGYYLHKKNADFHDTNQANLTDSCPIRTIYFKSPKAFREIEDFTYETAKSYDLRLEACDTDFKTGLEDLSKKKPTKAIFMGTRTGDPNAIGQEQFSPSSPGWPPFMRVNPILNWSYRDVWSFIKTCEVKYCSLYDQGYTSIGSTVDTVQNEHLSTVDSSGVRSFKPAYELLNGRHERAGRTTNAPPITGCNYATSNGIKIVELVEHSSCSASIIVVGDEILFGSVEDKVGSTLCRKLFSIGWQVSRIAVVRNEIDAVAEEVKNQKSSHMVFLCGGLLYGVSLAGFAKAFDVHLAPEEIGKYQKQLIESGSGDRHAMPWLPEVFELRRPNELSPPLIKCENAVLLASTDVNELDKEWDALQGSPGFEPVQMSPFSSRHLSSSLSDSHARVEAATGRLLKSFGDGIL